MKSAFAKNAHLAELEVLEQRLNAAQDIADKGELLLELEDIRTRNDGLLRMFNRLPEIFLTAGMFCGVVALLALNPASLSAVPVLIGAIAIAGGASWLAAIRIGKESKDLVKSIAKKTAAGIQNIISDENPLAMAKSLRFEKVMAAFPELKEKFILAAGKLAAQNLPAASNTTAEPPRKTPAFNL